MKAVLITGGGTAERIDSVRRITNDSTGALAALTCEQFLQAGVDALVVYVAAKGAVLPQDSEKFSAAGKLKIVQIESASDALTAIQNLCRQFEVVAIIHAMAVSDFCVQKVFDAAQVCDVTVGALLSGEKIAGTAENRITKISSSIANPIVLLGQTPKIISHLRELSPQAIIVGFKLLSEVSENELWQVAAALLQKNQLDFVLANDAKYFEEKRHVAFLLDKDCAATLEPEQTKNCKAGGKNSDNNAKGKNYSKTPIAIEGKNQIAKKICEAVLEKIK